MVKVPAAKTLPLFQWIDEDGQCGNGRDTCEGRACVDYFQNVIAVAGKKMCDIRGAGVMGKGVFANQTIPSESIIGEYLGRLHPPKSLPVHDRYVFVIPEIGEVTANQFGNLTRFVNHHCDPNVTARVGMYGKRQVVLYVANREIKAGEQLFVDYGSVYFSLPDYPCSEKM
ncbi:Histone-lysine N-methyltransferase ehmt1 [Diaporthe eres]